MRLSELFDSKPVKISWTKQQDKWTGGFEINEIPFVMFIAKDFLPTDESGWPAVFAYNTAFGVDNYALKKVLSKTKNPALEKFKDKGWVKTHGILGTGNQGLVFSTVITGIKEFIKSKKPEYITFSAEEPSRIKLYRRMSKTIGRAIGMKLVYDNSGEFILQNTKAKG